MLTREQLDEGITLRREFLEAVDSDPATDGDDMENWIWDNIDELLSSLDELMQKPNENMRDWMKG